MSKSFQGYLNNASNKTNLVNYIFQQWKEILSEHISSYQSVYTANLYPTKECSQRIEFYCDYEEAGTKIFSYIKFLSNTVQLKRVIIDSSDTDLTVISLYHCATNFALLDLLWFKIVTGK